MGNILILNGSPRREGNTSLLCRALKESAEEKHAAEILRVSELAIGPCIGCEACRHTAGHRCVQRDGMDAVFEHLRRADTLVIASPVYFYGLSAQLKTLVDRLHAPMRQELPIRRLALMLTAGADFPDVFDAILEQYRMTLRYFGLQDAGRVLARGVREPGAVLQSPALEEARALGARL